MFNTNESENMNKQQFDIGTYFTIQYYAKKHNKTVTREEKILARIKYDQAQK